ncbi:MAG TPA: class E sortase [Acidimicrobiales bacterium]|nr:class E sortase [Acidimicrobiales bacterium]
MRTALRGLGKGCISAGVLILLFVAYQLWGTGIAEARSQRSLKHQFAASLPSSTTTAPTTSAPPSTDATTTTTAAPLPPLPAPPTGSAVAIIKIPRIGVTDAVVEGVGVEDLKKGPGHYPRTPLPGQAGNAAIAGHRTTYGAPFYRLNELAPGDDIFVSTRDGTFDYHVMFSHDVSPSDVSVLNATTDNRLTLTTCTPRFTATKRLVVVAALVGAVDPRPAAPVVAAPVATTIPGDTPGTTSAPPPLAGTDVGSLSGQGASTAPAVVWGVVCALVWGLAWAASHRWRKWAAYAIAAPVFLLALYFFFENFARFVPANL